MFAIWSAAGEFGTNNSDNRGDNISKVVDGFENDGDRICEESDDSFDGDKKNIGDNATNASLDDGGISVIHEDIIKQEIKIVLVVLWK